MGLHGWPGHFARRRALLRLACAFFPCRAGSKRTRGLVVIPSGPSQKHIANVGHTRLPASRSFADPSVHRSHVFSGQRAESFIVLRGRLLRTVRRLLLASDFLGRQGLWGGRPRSDPSSRTIGSRQRPKTFGWVQRQEVLGASSRASMLQERFACFCRS